MTEKSNNEHLASTDCHLPFRWSKPSDIEDYTCQYCGIAAVVIVNAVLPYPEQHWQCAKCDSTFPDWEYPLSLGQQCELWNRSICEQCDWVGQGVKAGLCATCRR